MKRLLSVFAILNFYFHSTAQVVTANFNAPDTVCVNQTFTIQNTTTGPASTYYWNFCLGNTNAAPQASNLGNIGFFGGPVYYSIGKDGTNYYAFVSNNSSGTISRLFYGSSLINTPVATNLGNLGGVIPVSVEDMHLEQQGGNWYGIVVGGVGGQIMRLNFGSSLGNTPTAVNMGNIGGLNYPQRLQIFSVGGNYYGFTVNRNGNTITRFNFGTSIANTPTGTNLGNIGALNIPDDLAIINYGGNWYGYIINEGSNTVTRLDFGTSLLNTPTGVNLGNTGALNGPRGIDVYVECNQVKGLIVNRFSNDLLNMNFPGGPTGPVITTSFGNIASFSFPHSIERYRVGDTLFAMIPNVNNNSLSRIYYPSCSNSSIPSSTLVNPPAVSYGTTGTYYISLTVNETQINQSKYCKPVVVISPPSATIAGVSSYCAGDSIKLYGSGPPGCTFQWSGPNSFTSTSANIVIPNAQTINAGSYSLTVSKNSCVSAIIVKNVIINSIPVVNLGNDTSICTSPFFLQLNAQNPGSSYLWSNGATTQTIAVNTIGNYSVLVTSGAGCKNSDAINVTNNVLSVAISGNTVICPQSGVMLDAGISGATYTWSSGQISQTITVNAPGTYSVIVFNNGCTGTDLITVISPSLNLGPDASICQGGLITLNALNQGSSYLWSTGATSQTIQASAAGNYWVNVSTIGGCSLSDTLKLTVNPSPVVSLGQDTSYCDNKISINLILDAANPGASYNWSTGANTQTISVSTPGTFSVLVTNLQGCSSLGKIEVKKPNLNVNLGPDKSFCEGKTVVLNAGNTGSNYLWSTGQQTQSLTVNSSGTYWVNVTNGKCTERDTINLNLIQIPVFTLGPDTVICPGETLLLSGGYYPQSTYSWSDGSSEQDLAVKAPGLYTVKANISGCDVGDEIYVEDCDSEIWIPNSFSPNGDNINETFFPVCYNIETLELIIFDRWGEEIFRGENYDAIWDGKYKGQLCEPGIYTYKIEYKQKRKLKQATGHIALLQ